MICKVCGHRPDQKERFCSACGSYFIDAESPEDSHEWKGIISPDGTITDQGKSNANLRNRSGKTAGTEEPANAWAILGLCFSGTLLLINIIDMLLDGMLFFLGAPAFVMTLVSVRFSNRYKFNRISVLVLILGCAMFMIRVLKL